jgi:glutamate--cysteine ligase
MLDTLKSIVRQDANSLDIRRGLERETLRTDAKGELARTLHPDFLGSKLCHPLITTDFSESQLEIITPVCKSVDEALDQLNDTHRFVYSGLQGGLLWPTSMPCSLPTEIPLAQYGSSNLARLKETYRHGLGYRYGRTMQTICAVHYNFSLPDSFWHALQKIETTSETAADFRNRRHFDLMRNFRRFSWLPTYLFGASPAVSSTFLTDRNHNLMQLDSDTWYQPDATSLRNGGLGYQSATQAGLLDICYNSLDNYIHTLATAITTKHDDYAAGKPGQELNANILQSEAEFYTSIRAKRVPDDGENLLRALHRDGVEYIEVRLLDVCPYAPVGIEADTINFIDTLLIYCLLTPSPDHDDALCASVEANMQAVVHGGRRPTMLSDMGQRLTFTDWGTGLLDELLPIAEFLDSLTGHDDHCSALSVQARKLNQPELTPSGKMLNDMQNASFHEFALVNAREHREYFLAQPLTDSEKNYFNELARTSMIAQQQKEAQTEPSFTEYLAEIERDYESLL